MKKTLGGFSAVVLALAAVALVLLVGVGWLYLRGGGGGDERMEKVATVSEDEVGDGEEATESIDDILAGFLDEDYRVTVTTDGLSDEQVGTITIEFDAPNTTRSTVQTPQGTMETIVTPEASYTRFGGGKWMKSLIEGDAKEDVNTDGYSREDLENMAQNPWITYQGKGPCSAGVCDVYGGEYDGTKTKMFIADSKPMRVEVSTPQGQTTVMEYVYTDITIEIPTDAAELPTLTPGAISPEDVEKMMENLPANL